jgi:hypothetical protein
MCSRNSDTGEVFEKSLNLQTIFNDWICQPHLLIGQNSMQLSKQELLRKTEAAAMEFRKLREQNERHQKEKEAWEMTRADLECKLRESKHDSAQRAASAEQTAKAMSTLFDRETSRLLGQLEESESCRRAADRRILELESELGASIQREQEILRDDSIRLTARNKQLLCLRSMLDRALEALSR